ncbi:MAG: hypothetical protein Tsb0010_03640 [Parvularculaceae bacterium]
MTEGPIASTQPAKSHACDDGRRLERRALRDFATRREILKIAAFARAAGIQRALKGASVNRPRG